ncbi:MAG: sugar transferase [Verrucomicrobiaceae bacterium]|nr:sugar transferase [Verrucomicrobiaceae bacterium]
MLGRRQEINLQLTELVDSALLAAALWLSYVFRAYFLQSQFPDLELIPAFDEFLWVFAVVVPFTPIVLESRGFYNGILNKSLITSVKQMFSALLVMATIIGAFVVFFRWNVPSRSVTLIAIPMAGFVLLLREAWQRDRHRRRLLTGNGRQRVLLAGLPSDVDRLLGSMSPEQRAEIEVMGRVDLTGQPVSDLVAEMRAGSVARVIFAAQHIHFGRIEEAVQACETEGVESWVCADFFQTSIARPTFDVLGGKLMLVFHTTPQISWSLWCKEVLDRSAALVLLILSSPLWIVAVVGIRLSSRGPIFFHQERAGLYGKGFRMWKFRTMHPDAEAMQKALAAQNEMDGPVFKIKSDPRIFAFGSWLRKFSIDELPQLINVLRGEMSLVGPRPLPMYEIAKIEKDAQRRRLSVKPGLTCLWQISGRNRITSFDEWVALDLKYIDNWSIWLDFKILAQTLPAVMKGSGAS